MPIDLPIVLPIELPIVLPIELLWDSPDTLAQAALLSIAADAQQAMAREALGRQHL